MVISEIRGTLLGPDYRGLLPFGVYFRGTVSLRAPRGSAN